MQRVVGIVLDEFVLRGREEHARIVHVAQHRMHAGNGQRGGGVDVQDACVGVRGTGQFHVQQAGQLPGGDVQGVAGLARHDGVCRGGRDVAPHGARRGGIGVVQGAAFLRRVRTGVPVASQHGVLDGPVAGAAAEVALEVPGQVLQLLLVEGRGRHDQPGGAEAALESLGPGHLLLHGRQRSGGSLDRGEALDGGHFAALGAHRRVDARMHRNRIDMDGAGAAVPAVAALLHAQRALGAQEGAQALPRLGGAGGRIPVDVDGHGTQPSIGTRGAGNSSARTSRPRRWVIASRHGGRPWMSS